MNNDVKSKAKLLLAGLAVMPAMATAQPGEMVRSAYHSPYNDEDQGSLEDHQNSMLTGLTTQQLQEARTLVAELNQQDVVTAQAMNLTKAPVVPYRYNLPLPQDVEAARAKNLDRLAKLRAMIEAAK